MQKTLLKLFYACLIGNLIVSCATSKQNTSSINNNSNIKSILPKVPKTSLPGGNTDNWRYIGTTDNNQIADEIDNNSIKSINIQIYQFLDRKTIVSPNNFVYANQQQPYKFALGLWTINCIDKKYILNQMSIYDTYGTLIKTYDYTSDSNVKWLIIGDKTIAEMQYEYICLSQNKNLGY
ncbi:MAG: hypothetical protein LW807_00195 [Proteobacteria bacterium]|jgi:hypothetical protein|nr:hypothetical protein [Pseudomonadota bacterium]